MHDRLALASYKTQHGQESLRFNDVEARLEKTIEQKRSVSGAITSSPSSSSSSEHHLRSGCLTSSPFAAHVVSDDFHSLRRRKMTRKRSIHHTNVSGEHALKASKRIRSQSLAPQFEPSCSTWKTVHNLPVSSPVYHQHESRCSSSHRPNLSFASEVSKIPHSPTFGHISEEDDADLPARSFRINSSTLQSSPPQTPPARGCTARQGRGIAPGEEGADLLIYLATSPSPANPAIKPCRIFSPSTPPSNTQELPSSMISTPGMGDFSTPGQQFNFADFVNITPSPAQGAFGNRTPGVAKTPLAAKEARRRLNFDTLVPPVSSPNLGNMGRGSSNKDPGLGMELGGELVS